MNVYCLYLPNGKRYVGVEAKTGRRISDHARMASIRDKGESKAQVVHLAIRKHGWENVRWRYLATNCAKADAYALEKTFIRLFRTQDPEWGYNRSAGGEDSGLGVKRRPETIAKAKATRRANGTDQMREAHSPDGIAAQVASRRRGAGWKPFPAEHAFRGATDTSFVRGQSPWNTGQPMPAETREKISAAKRGRPPAHDKGFQKGHSLGKGRSLSEETKRKISEAKRGRSAAHGGTFRKGRVAHNKGCHDQIAWNKGVPMSDESRRKLSESKRGRIMLPAGPNGEMRAFRPEQLI